MTLLVVIAFAEVVSDHVADLKRAYFSYLSGYALLLSTTALAQDSPFVIDNMPDVATFVSNAFKG